MLVWAQAKPKLLQDTCVAYFERGDEVHCLIQVVWAQVTEQRDLVGLKSIFGRILKLPIEQVEW